MKDKLDVKSLVSGALLGVVIMFSVAAATYLPRCEYKVITGHLRPVGGDPDPALASQVEQAAADGWDVVTATSDEGRPVVILRRPK